MTKRMSADDRRTAVIEAALTAFARTGLHGTAVSTITDQVGITQPYAFSLFRSKKGLYIATVEYCLDRFEETFRLAAERAPKPYRIDAMAMAYNDLMASEPDIMRFVLKCFATTDDDEIRAVAQRRMKRLFDLVKEIADDDEQAKTFIGQGILCMVASTLDTPFLLPDPPEVPGMVTPLAKKSTASGKTRKSG